MSLDYALAAAPTGALLAGRRAERAARRAALLRDLALLREHAARGAPCLAFGAVLVARCADVELCADLLNGADSGGCRGGNQDAHLVEQEQGEEESDGDGDGDKDVLTTLEELLGSPDADARRCAVGLMLRLTSATARPVALAMVSKEDLLRTNVRAMSARPVLVRRLSALLPRCLDYSGGAFVAHAEASVEAIELATRLVLGAESSGEELCSALRHAVRQLLAQLEQRARSERRRGGAPNAQRQACFERLAFRATELGLALELPAGRPSALLAAGVGALLLPAALSDADEKGAARAALVEETTSAEGQQTPAPATTLRDAEPLTLGCLELLEQWLVGSLGAAAAAAAAERKRKTHVATALLRAWPLLPVVLLDRLLPQGSHSRSSVLRRQLAEALLRAGGALAPAGCAVIQLLCGRFCVLPLPECAAAPPELLARLACFRAAKWARDAAPLQAALRVQAAAAPARPQSPGPAAARAPAPAPARRVLLRHADGAAEDRSEDGPGPHQLLHKPSLHRDSAGGAGASGGTVAVLIIVAAPEAVAYAMDQALDEALVATLADITRGALQQGNMVNWANFPPLRALALAAAAGSPAARAAIDQLSRSLDAESVDGIAAWVAGFTAAEVARADERGIAAHADAAAASAHIAA